MLILADPFSMPIANGVYADTGDMLPLIDGADIADFRDAETRGGWGKSEEAEQAQVKLEASGPSFAVVEDVASKELSQAGWGVLFSSTCNPAIIAALDPLLKHREAQAGGLYRRYAGSEGYLRGDTASGWLSRQNVRLDIVDPMNGVPFYLMLVGSPGEIPMEFQYVLDIHWAVGRLHFETLDEYRRYADSVVSYEMGSTVRSSRQVALFATRHDGDRPTELFAMQVAMPLMSSDPRGPLGHKQGFRLQSHIGDQATKSALTELLRGRFGQPSVLMTGSHGAVFRTGDPRQYSKQGAIVCQDWSGSGPISEYEFFAESDIPRDAQLHGLIHFFFACFSAGWPEFDTFAARGKARRLSPEARFARLPQAMLSRGALATIGHMDRAWIYSFQSVRGGPQIQSFRDVIGRLLRGDRIGQATDAFNLRWAGLSAELTELMRRLSYRSVSDAELASLWVARDDARNYVVYGDPAVRLRVEDMESS
jgi:hypothetical protein